MNVKNLLPKSMNDRSSMNVGYYLSKRPGINRSGLVCIVALVLIQIISGCTTASKYHQGQFDKEIPELNVYALLDREFSSEYFGSFRFIFQNTGEDWYKIDSLSLFFEDKNAQKYIRVLSKEEQADWDRAFISQTVMEVSTVKELQSVVLGAGASMTGVTTGLSQTVGLEDGGKDTGYGRNHLYAKNFIVPPGFTLEKWALLNSSHHSEIPYVTDLSLAMHVDNEPRKVRVKFRQESRQHSKFIWYDPARDVYMNFYLGVSLGMALPVGEFKDVVNTSDNLINSFGVNGYLSLLKNLGVNFALDYEKFPARGVLPIPFDSLNAVGTQFEFKYWEIYSLLISPRFVYPLNKEMELFAELSIGAALSNTARVLIKRAGVEVGEIDPATDISFMAGIGAGSRFYLSDKMNLDLKVEYLPLPKPTFTTNDPDNHPYVRTQKLSQVRIKVTANWDI